MQFGWAFAWSKVERKFEECSRYLFGNPQFSIFLHQIEAVERDRTTDVPFLEHVRTIMRVMAVNHNELK